MYTRTMRKWSHNYNWMIKNEMDRIWLLQSPIWVWYRYIISIESQRDMTSLIPLNQILGAHWNYRHLLSFLAWRCQRFVWVRHKIQGLVLACWSAQHGDRQGYDKTTHHSEISRPTSWHHLSQQSDWWAWPKRNGEKRWTDMTCSCFSMSERSSSNHFLATASAGRGERERGREREIICPIIDG